MKKCLPEFYGSTVVSDKGQGIMLMKVSALEKMTAEMTKHQEELTKIIKDI